MIALFRLTRKMQAKTAGFMEKAEPVLANQRHCRRHLCHGSTLVSGRRKSSVDSATQDEEMFI